MRKFFVHYSTGHENIRAIVEADSPRAAMIQIRKTSKRATIYSIQDIAQMEASTLASSITGAGDGV